MLLNCQLSFIRQWLRSEGKLRGPGKDSKDLLPMQSVLHYCSTDSKGLR